ncbi:MAG: 4-(cytidine 5'-diphospho)-2-C-methyl-D-erythritol kinase [Proteobacteria bacterium]|nr:4-(cytidine 5'-diphospho)-2-C-methyl-D-erythritol kinase [Pseudomonadota bacterium]
MSVRVFAPAKINLTLEVGPPRDDGMHPLQSVVAFADVGDIVEAEASDDLSLKIGGDFADQLSEGDVENLVLRAARALARSAGVDAKAALSLEKNLPVASGIGGGSSDAAAALRALAALWEIDAGTDALQAVARLLGADVPVCLRGAPAWMTGLGEIWTPISLPPFAAVLVNPLRELATPLVYREFDRMRLGGAFAASAAPHWRDRSEALSGIVAAGNALTAPAQSLMPDVALVIEILRNDARVEHAAMSGSGATCFALVGDLAAAERLAADLRAAHPDWWVVETELGGA